MRNVVSCRVVSPPTEAATAPLHCKAAILPFMCPHHSPAPPAPIGQSPTLWFNAFSLHARFVSSFAALFTVPVTRNGIRVSAGIYSNHVSRHRRIWASQCYAIRLRQTSNLWPAIWYPGLKRVEESSEHGQVGKGGHPGLYSMTPFGSQASGFAPRYRG